MEIEIRRRLPVGEQHLPRVLRLFRVHRQRIAVVVVADVLVVEPRQPGAFVFGADVLVVEVRDHDFAVGVERRHQQEDDVVEDALGLGVGARQQIVGELRRHLRAADFARVHAHRHQCERLARGSNLPDLRLGDPARVAQLQVVLPELFEVLLVGRRRDDQQQEGVPHLGGPHIDRFQPAAAFFLQESVVLDQLVPTRHLAIGAHLEAEELLGRGDGGGGALLGRGRRCGRRVSAATRVRRGNGARDQHTRGRNPCDQSCHGDPPV